MHSLIITAHPNAQGFTHQIAGKYQKVREEAGHTVQILNLYAPENRQEFLTYKDQKELSARGQQLNAIQKEIQKADELVFIFPVWWYDVPAILKNFLDMNFAPGFAFSYSSRGIKGLFTGKTMRFFSTAAAPALIYRLGFLPYVPSFRKSLKDCGIRLSSKTIFGSRRGPNGTQEKKWLEDVRVLAAI
ncbi:MAG: hypothetical protein JWM56_553 [Candidatus Peribacteria bacterium]|nr:hypothetical protein [Candidatus Peribacteria bacterium]